MAIDTAEKKFSLMAFDEIWDEALPVPDGSLDQGDLQHTLWSYSGLLWADLPNSGGGSSGTGRSATHRKNTIRPSTHRSGTVR